MQSLARSSACETRYLQCYTERRRTSDRANSLPCATALDDRDKTGLAHRLETLCGWHASRRGDSRKEPKHMYIIWVLLIGLIVGALAKLVMPGRDPGGAIVTILIGIAGSFIANYIGRAAGWYAPNESAGFIASILGAVVLLAGYRLIAGRRTVVR
jgi:uncharacterized membrane protein YeaQ/YmgE (transglycosylase-associated protein family)